MWETTPGRVMGVVGVWGRGEYAVAGESRHCQTFGKGRKLTVFCKLMCVVNNSYTYMLTCDDELNVTVR